MMYNVRGGNFTENFYMAYLLLKKAFCILLHYSLMDYIIINNEYKQEGRFYYFTNKILFREYTLIPGVVTKCKTEKKNN